MNQYNNHNIQHYTHQYNTNNLHLSKQTPFIPIYSPSHYYRSVSTGNIRPIMYGPQGNNFTYNIEGLDYNPYRRFGARKYDNGVVYINGKRYHNKQQKDNSLRNRNNQYGWFSQEKQTQLSYNPLQIEQSNEMFIENNPFPSFKKIPLREQKAIRFDIKPTLHKVKCINDRYFEPNYYLRNICRSGFRDNNGRAIVNQRNNYYDNYSRNITSDYKDNYMWYKKSNYYDKMNNYY